MFADLMLWGWLRRSVAERRLAQAETLLGNDPQGASVEALIGLSELLEARDARTYGHSQRVTRHAERIATTMGLPAAEVAKVRTAAALHDVGKLHTPRSILNKPGRLTDSEFALIKRHPVDGAVMASGIGDPEITAMIRHHHERLDGRGYPDGLAGEDIPLGARIIAVADTFDAITSNRTYRRASHHKRALDVLVERGRQAARRRRRLGVPRLLPRPAHGRAVGLHRLRPAALPVLARRRLAGDRRRCGDRDLAADRPRQLAAGRLLTRLGRRHPRPARRLGSEARERRGREAARRSGPQRPVAARLDGRRGAAPTAARQTRTRRARRDAAARAPPAGGDAAAGGGGSAPRPTPPQPGTERPVVPDVDAPNVPCGTPQGADPEVSVPR